jgi:enoyl-CoA hydratase/carnithine racemase
MFRIETQGLVGLIRYDNPPVNAAGFAAWRALPGLAAQLAADAELAAVVVTGLPHRHFSAGNDVREFAGLSRAEAEAGLSAVRDGIRAVAGLEMPVIAAVHGAAAGSACMLACACDIRICTSDARFSLPEVKVGAFGGYRLLREVMPRGEARWMTLTGRPIGGERAHAIGLVQELAPDRDALLPQAVALAEEIGTLLRSRFGRAVKPALDRSETAATLWDAYEVEQSVARDVMGRG